MTEKLNETEPMPDSEPICANRLCETVPETAHSATDSTAPPDERAERGRTVTGQPGPALRHGGRSRLVAEGKLPEQAEALAALPSRTAAILADLGGDVSAVALGLVERHARLEMVSDYLWSNLQAHGPLTGKGATRAALSAWLLVVDRLHRSATTLGLDRKAKRVPTLQEVLDGDD